MSTKTSLPGMGESDGMFRVSRERGFLPCRNPMARLPDEYGELERLLQEMPIKRADGSPGLLDKETLGLTIEKGALPLYEVHNVDDLDLLHALFRDYTFLASAYLLEPCHKRFLASGEYGLARSKLPKCISVPLCAIAKRLNVHPFMEYALSYALMNWQLADERAGFKVENMKLIRAFEGSTDEAGFILVHVAMVSHTSKLVAAAEDCLRCQNGQELVDPLGEYYKQLCLINTEMETMWKYSHRDGYNQFRTFIMGIKDQPMFPEGVVYEGVVDEESGEVSPKYFFRGESGANDSIIPLSDNILQLTAEMPDNPLTMILRDFRTYRPPPQNAFLKYVEQRSKLIDLRSLALSNPKASQYYLGCLDKVREFRSRHWNFTKEYILRQSKHPVATGGSPIVTWLPNQLRAVLLTIVSIKVPDAHGIKRLAKEQLLILDGEVNELRLKYGQ